MKILNGYTGSTPNRRPTKEIPMNGKSLLLYMVLPLAANDLYAQTETGTISGKITNGSKPLEAASVGLHTGKDSLLARTTLTGADGSFVFDRLKPGNYYIVARMSGFTRYKTGGLLHQQPGKYAGRLEKCE
ncbi:MAG: carboxypeptidase-like regulatory domain-containing protein [Chitinophagaceae bacterium]